MALDPMTATLQLNHDSHRSDVSHTVATNVPTHGHRTGGVSYAEGMPEGLKPFHAMAMLDAALPRGRWKGVADTVTRVPRPVSVVPHCRHSGR
jgi:hypothetical protein